MDESKYIEVSDSGYTWQFPAYLIAKDRATYYASNDEDTTYDEEFKFTMGDDYELRDWFLNNMDWRDVSKSARLKRQPFVVQPDLSDSEVQQSVEVVLVDR